MCVHETKQYHLVGLAKAEKAAMDGSGEHLRQPYYTGFMNVTRLLWSRQSSKILFMPSTLSPIHTADTDATKLCRVGVGGVNTIRN